MFKGLQLGYTGLDRKRQAILKKIAKVGPFIMATPTLLKVRCGHKSCACAEDPEARHEKLHLSWRDAEGNGTAYVPVDLHEEVREWVANYWKVKDLMKEMTDVSRQMIRIYAKTEGRIRRKRAKAEAAKKS